MEISAVGNSQSSLGIYANFPKAAIPEEPSRYRKWRDVAFKCIWDVPASVISYYYSEVSLETELSSEEYQSVKKFLARLTAEGVIKRLQSKGAIGTAAFLSYLNGMPSTFKALSNFLHPRRGESAYFPKEELEKDKVRYLAIPVILSSSVGHMVTFLIDLRENTIEFYDPQGLTILDRRWHPLLSNLRIDLEDLYIQLFKRYGNENTVLKQNTVKHQYDVHNCGVHVIYFLLQRTGGITFEYIVNHGKGFFEANNTLRARMIHSIATQVEIK